MFVGGGAVPVTTVGSAVAVAVDGDASEDAYGGVGDGDVEEREIAVKRFLGGLVARNPEVRPVRVVATLFDSERVRYHHVSTPVGASRSRRG